VKRMPISPERVLFALKAREAAAKAAPEAAAAGART
jgi:hypothetical protein